METVNVFLLLYLVCAPSLIKSCSARGRAVSSTNAEVARICLALHQTYQKVDPSPDDENGAAGRGGGAVRACYELKHSNWFDIT